MLFSPLARIGSCSLLLESALRRTNCISSPCVSSEVPSFVPPVGCRLRRSLAFLGSEPPASWCVNYWPESEIVCNNSASASLAVHISRSGAQASGPTPKKRWRAATADPTGRSQRSFPPRALTRRNTKGVWHACMFLLRIIPQLACSTQRRDGPPHREPDVSGRALVSRGNSTPDTA